MKAKTSIISFCTVLLATNTVFAQDSTISTTDNSTITTLFGDPCATDATNLIGKWDGIWSFARIEAVLDVSSAYAKEGKCFLKFKLYQKTNEVKSGSYKVFEMHLKQGDKVDFDRVAVDRPVADIWGTIDKQAGKIVINHKRPEFPLAGYAEFKKRVQ